VAAAKNYRLFVYLCKQQCQITDAPTYVHSWQHNMRWGVWTMVHAPQHCPPALLLQDWLAVKADIPQAQHRGSAKGFTM
jgi:hypothetical protein